MGKYLIFKRGVKINQIGDSGISLLNLDLVHTGGFNEIDDAKAFIAEHDLPKGEYIILQAEIFNY